MSALLALLFALAPGASAQTPKDLYDAGRYAQAADAFEVATQAAPRDAALRYNLGNALFKSGHLGRAIASYERAFALDPRDLDTRHNLQFALKRAGEEFVPPGAPPALFWLFTLLSERELAGLHWLAAWAALLLVAGVLLLPSAGERMRSAAAIATACWLFFGLWWAGLRAALPPDRGVIVSAQAEVRHGPGTNFGVAFTAPEGRRVKILGSSGAWIEVGVLKEGAQGWIEASAVERL